MTRKQIRKLANQISELELIHKNPDSSKEEKAQAERQIIQLSGMLACLPNGLDIMSEIDELVQTRLHENEILKEND